MNKASDILGRVARRLNHPEASLAWLSSSWPQIVGKTLAGHTSPLRCRNGRLDIAADTKAWQKQLEHMRSDFCARINQAWGSNLIREVKFVVGKRSPGTAASSALKRIPYEFDNEHTPFIRRRK
jgi:predicted nucleic acid-binding Zn ribbon protein